MSSSRRSLRERSVEGRGSPGAGAASPESETRERALTLEYERRLHRLLVAALDLPAERRRDHVVTAAGAERELAADVLALLTTEADLGAFLETPAVVDLRYVEAARPEAPGEDGDSSLPPVPATIGPYAVVERLGAGGMGEVFRARQEEPVRREVALKRLHTHLGAEARERFLVEQRTLALLSHSNVARLYDAGTTADGCPYFAMELVAGLPITEYCDTHDLPVAERLRIFLQVAAGVEHAHRHQVLHRDLKPSNVLVVEESGRPVPKVIDFGIAKSLDPVVPGVTLDTSHGLLGTPAYMSPEALAPQRTEGGVDTRADVYSLGVLLFELLTGRTHFGEDSGLVALLARVEAGAAETPSRSLRRLEETDSGAVAARRGTTPPGLQRTVGGDLDWIVSKAMAPERERRYGSLGATGRPRSPPWWPWSGSRSAPPVSPSGCCGPAWRPPRPSRRSPSPGRCRASWSACSTPRGRARGGRTRSPRRISSTAAWETSPPGSRTSPRPAAASCAPSATSTYRWGATTRPTRSSARRSGCCAPRCPPTPRTSRQWCAAGRCSPITGASGRKRRRCSGPASGDSIPPPTRRPGSWRSTTWESCCSKRVG